MYTRVCNKYVQICPKSGKICCCCSRNERYWFHFHSISVRIYKIGRVYTRARTCLQQIDRNRAKFVVVVLEMWDIVNTFARFEDPRPHKYEQIWPFCIIWPISGKSLNLKKWKSPPLPNFWAFSLFFFPKNCKNLPKTAVFTLNFNVFAPSKSHSDTEHMKFITSPTPFFETWRD